MSAEIYWVGDVPVGRLAIVGRPRSGDWLVDEITDWKSAGLTDIVSLLEDWEVRELELHKEHEIAEQLGLSFTKFPIRDRGLPASSEAAHELWNALASKIRAGRSVGVHCRAGIGRSGLVAAGVLIRLGVPEMKAWEQISQARGRSVPDTEEQRSWLGRQFGRVP
jgi:protein-tyrosine phosphatase